MIENYASETMIILLTKKSISISNITVYGVSFTKKYKQLEYRYKQTCIYYVVSHQKFNL